MYLCIGADAVLRREDIVGIFDLDNTTVSARTRTLLSKMQKEGAVRDASDGELPKSMILYREGDRCLLWLSQYAPKTLAKRAASRSGGMGFVPMRLPEEE